MVAKTKKDDGGEITILKIKRGRTTFCILGTTPIILNCVSEKVKRELLLPRGRKTAADKASSLKHDPLQEYRDSPYYTKNDKDPTSLMLPSTMFKAAIRSVALDMPGAARTQIGRLTFVEGESVSLFGVPQMIMSVTRCADANKTPDIRTRAIIPKWGCRVTIEFVIPLLREQTVVDLLAAAGVMRGVGDWRPEKGAGAYGQFDIVAPDDPRFVAVMKRGRAEQVSAMRAPTFYDVETERLYLWFVEESKSRGFDEGGTRKKAETAPVALVAAAAASAASVANPAGTRRRRGNGRPAS